MNKKTLPILVILALAALTWLGFAGGQKLNKRFDAIRRDENPDTFVGTIATTSTDSNSSDWVSGAMTIDELMLESDLVVRVRATSAPVTRVVPIYPLDQQGNKIESAVFPVLFSDTVFEVIKTYVGTPLLTITVMQTGGYDSTVSKGIEEMADDPLYKIGEVYVLFLVDISGDHVHAPNRALYRIVNPFGRYRVDDTNVVTYGQNPLRLIQLPTKLLELETQIEQAKGNFVK